MNCILLFFRAELLAAKPLRPWSSSIRTGVEGDFSRQVSSKEHYPERPYARVMPGLTFYLLWVADVSCALSLSNAQKCFRSMLETALHNFDLLFKIETFVCNKNAGWIIDQQMKGEQVLRSTGCSLTIQN
jgi:hypothetical protein